MKRTPTLIAVVLTAALTVKWTSEAKAQIYNFTYVSTSGNDGNNCTTIATPCRTFVGAAARAGDGGTIQCLGAGGYGVATVSVSLTIDCLGRGSGNAQSVFINAPGKTVVLRNIGLDGTTIQTPLNIQAAANVYIENALIVTAGPGSPGIADTRAGPGKLVIRNSSIVNHGGVGVLVTPASGIIGVELDNVISAYNSRGLAVGSGGQVMIRNSVFTGNGTGIAADPGAIIGISSSEISFNSVGISAAASASITLSSSQLSSNSTAISGATRSTGNNRLFANTGNGTAPTIVSGQ